MEDTLVAVVDTLVAVVDNLVAVVGDSLYSHMVEVLDPLLKRIGL